MTRREELLERLEETVFALMMDEVAKEEGQRALEENERLKQDESFVVPEASYRKCLATIKKYFAQQTGQVVMRTTSRLISRVAVIVLVMLLLFTTAFAASPSFRAKTMNLITEVFDDRTRIEFGVSVPAESDEESESIVNWVPEGFELVEKGESNIVVWEKYSNSNGALVEVNMYYGESVACDVDTEKAITKDVIVSGHPSIAIFKEDVIQIVCPVAEEKLIYRVLAQSVNYDVALEIVESIKF